MDARTLYCHRQRGTLPMIVGALAITESILFTAITAPKTLAHSDAVDLALRSEAHVLLGSDDLPALIAAIEGARRAS